MKEELFELNSKITSKERYELDNHALIIQNARIPDEGYYKGIVHGSINTDILTECYIHLVVVGE